MESGLLVRYDFTEGGGETIFDRSGQDDPLDLVIERPESVRWSNGALSITSATSIVSKQPLHRIVNAIKKTNEISIEAWLKPANVSQAGPARIVSLSIDTSQRDFTLGQDKDFYDVRLRATGSDNNGMPSTSSPSKSLQLQQTHVLFTRDAAGSATLFIDGKPVASKMVSGNLGNWDAGHRLTLANEVTRDRPWLGELYLVAIYDRALPGNEVARNFAAGMSHKPATVPPEFRRDIQPLLASHCVKCHGDKKQQGGLRFDVRTAAVRAGDSGAVSIVPGHPEQSELMHRITSRDDDKRMPPEGDPLSEQQIELLRLWISAGARWPADANSVAQSGRKEMVVTDEDRQHWSYRPLRQAALPSVKQAEWVRTPIDHFILAKLEAAGLSPSPPVAVRKLVRRTFFDVIGLPPELKEDGGRLKEERLGLEFDPSAPLHPSSLTDKLLDSPHYGERWGRHWLDVARYADSDGQETDRDRPQAYHYRDFVIRALNDDMPFDQFVRWQLAGNEYEPDNPAAVAATGFLTAGPFAALPDKLMRDELLRNRYNELDDMVSTIGTGLLGLTFGCARCHDHKYDAVPARDYYRILSALHCGDRAEVTVGPSKEKLLAYRDASPVPSPTWLFRRGDYYDHEIPVTLGFLTVLTRDKSPEDYWREAREKSPVKDSSLQRRALADWITDADHGAGALVARVIVNRVWQHHFGNGLVRTIGDFGVRSEVPSHPELLEWLAHDLVQNGWKLKRLHRLILTSATYQQASSGRLTPAADPDNRLLWKMNPQRLEAEILRDEMLAVSGTLNLEAYGPGFKPPIAGEAMLARNIKDPYPKDVKDSAAVRRRSVYMFHKRVIPNPLMQAFDKPDAQQTCNRRDPTTVAPQALALLNDQFVRTTALDFADRLLMQTGTEPAKCVERGYQLAVCRAPSDTERQASVEFLETQIQARTTRDSKTSVDEARRRAVADWCQILFSLNEFLYVD
ncbi:MAG: DUF1553 domain-containing protein [Planctomycetes bacterium]|nr:DUF1553 domain-containing protein [Planctomycetota bacterium]